MRNRTLSVIAILLFFIMLVPILGASEDEDSLFDNLPRRLHGVFAETLLNQYSLSARINPYYVAGDFDGDGKLDYAVAVTDKKGAMAGILVFLAARRSPIVLGVGRQLKIAGTNVQEVKFDYWYVLSPSEVSLGPEEKSKPRLRGDSILIGDREGGSGVLFWDGAQFKWYPQGD